MTAASITGSVLIFIGLIISPAKEENRIDFTESSQKISTLLLTLLIIDVILHIEQRKGDRKGIFERGFQKKLLKRASKKVSGYLFICVPQNDTPRISPNVRLHCMVFESQ